MCVTYMERYVINLISLINLIRLSKMRSLKSLYYRSLNPTYDTIHEHFLECFFLQTFGYQGQFTEGQSFKIEAIV